MNVCYKLQHTHNKLLNPEFSWPIKVCLVYNCIYYLFCFLCSNFYHLLHSHIIIFYPIQIFAIIKLFIYEKVINCVFVSYFSLLNSLSLEISNAHFLFILTFKFSFNFCDFVIYVRIPTDSNSEKP